MRSTASRHPAGRIAAALALALALALSGCGGDSDGEAADSDATTQQADPGDGGAEVQGTDVPDLCSLLTAEDFAAVTGAAVTGEPEATPAAGAMRGTCSWSAEAGFPVLMVAAYNESERELTLEMVDSEPVDGLGTEADWAEATGVLFAVDGQDWYLQVLVMGTDDDRAASVAATEIVLENLS